MLILDHVQFRHGETDLQYDFSLQAKPGAIIGIMGASGSGKSTLLDLIAGFLVPSSGTLLWRDTNLIPLPPEDRPATILFQNHNLFDHLSAARNVAIGINAGRKISPDENRLVHQALAQVGLTGKEDRRVSRLSGGQQQRVALARSIVRNRPILLLDEPFSGLDEDTKSVMLDIIAELATRDNRCILMVTHDAADCAAIATSRYSVEQGILVPVR